MGISRPEVNGDPAGYADVVVSSLGENGRMFLSVPTFVPEQRFTIFFVSPGCLISQVLQDQL